MSSLVPPSEPVMPPSEMYLELLKRVLTRAIVSGAPERHVLEPTRPLSKAIYAIPKRLFASMGFELVRLLPFDAENYLESGHEARNRIEDAETMIGLRQFDNLQECIRDVLQNNVPGDLIEAGVWRGGVPIFMRGALKAYGDTKRRVWVADSFCGLPHPDPHKEFSFAWDPGEMAVSREEVEKHFGRYGLLDEGVSFLEGIFSDTLPGPIVSLSILRVDADLYDSTVDVLDRLYPLLSVGGLRDFRRLPKSTRLQEGDRPVSAVTRD